MLEHLINALHLICFCGYRNLSALSSTIPHLAFAFVAFMVLQCCVWINSCIRIRKQGVTNDNDKETIAPMYYLLGPLRHCNIEIDFDIACSTQVEWVIKHMWPAFIISWWGHEMEIFSTLLAPLCGESTSHWWIPSQRASNAKFSSKLTWISCERNSWVVYDFGTMALMWCHCNAVCCSLVRPIKSLLHQCIQDFLFHNRSQHSWWWLMHCDVIWCHM